MSYETFEFDVFGECFAHGNRQDREVTGNGSEEDWYSWQAEELPTYGLLAEKDVGCAEVTVYGDSFESQKFVVTWERLA